MKLKKRLNFRKNLRKARARAKLHGTSERPRLSVFRSNRFIYAQLIDDNNHQTLVSASDKELINGRQGKKVNKSERAKELGKMIAEKAKQAKINQAIFDKGPYQYHGRVRAVADGARDAGLKI